MNSRLCVDYRKARDAYNKRMQEEKEMTMKQLKILEVIAVGDDALECKGGMLDGIHTYPKDALTAI